jgi:SAM-dependent methyltransferase
VGTTFGALLRGCAAVVLVTMANGNAEARAQAQSQSEAKTSCESTLLYYRQNAEEFINRTKNLVVEKAHDRFLAKVPPKGRVMDLGVGSGRDSKIFQERGLQVFAVDASPEMAEQARKLLKQPVFVSRIQDLSLPAEALDAIWASASLLHLNPHDFVAALEMAYEALKTGGVFYFSVKIAPSSQEYVDEKGRYFFLWNKKELVEILDRTPFQIEEDWESKDLESRKGTQWLNIVLRKS